MFYFVITRCWCIRSGRKSEIYFFMVKMGNKIFFQTGEIHTPFEDLFEFKKTRLTSCSKNNALIVPLDQ